MSTAYFDALLAETRELPAGSAEAIYDRLEREEARLEAALEDARLHDPAAALSVAIFLGRFWFVRGRLAQGRRWIEQLLAALGPTMTSGRAQGLVAAANLAFRMGDNDVARRDATAALGLARRLGTRDLEIDSGLGLARVALRDTDPAAVRAIAGPAKELALEIKDEGRELAALHCLAEAARMAGDLVLARRCYTESLERNRARGSRPMMSTELSNLAIVERIEGHLDRATANLREAIELSLAIKNSYLLAANLVVLGTVHCAAGRYRDAARALGHADAIYAKTGLVIDPADEPEYDRALATIEAALGEPATRALRDEGATLHVEELLAATP